MSCSCSIDAYDEGCSTDFMREETPVARKSYKCCECQREIVKGEKYERVVGKWEGDFATFKTCMDCASIRDAFFCSFSFSRMFEDLREEIDYANGNLSQDCIAKLTPRAKDMVLEMIDEFLARVGKE